MFPNLIWAIDRERFARYQVARAAGMNSSRFSRCASGLAHFTQEERERIATFLGYAASWLFQEIRPPKRLRKDSVLIENNIAL